MDDEWVPMADIPRPGGWERIAAKMGIVVTPGLVAKVEDRRRRRRSEGIIREARFDEPPAPSTPDIWKLIDTVGEVMEVLKNQERFPRVTAPPPPRPTDPRPPAGGGKPGKGGVQLP